MEAVKRVFHIPQAVESCGGNVEESVENFSGKKREGQPQKPARGVPLSRLFQRKAEIPLLASGAGNTRRYGPVPLTGRGCF